jgi:hypothetical protein
MREIPRFIKYIPHLTCPTTWIGMYAKNGVGITSETLWPQEDVTVTLHNKITKPNCSVRYQIVKVLPYKLPSLLDKLYF